MTTKDIEEGAILALKNYIQGSEVISQHVSENDKEPFWDGHLYLYANADKTKDSFIGRVPVQLKGKDVDKFKRSKFKYAISVKDLKAYLHEPTVYIVCQEKNKGKDTLLFYRKLLPETIKNILKGKDKQDTVSVAMKSIPNSLEDFENILKVFCGDAKKQISYANNKPITLKDMKRRNIKNFSFVLPSRNMNPVDIMGYLSTHGSFLYAQINKEFNIEIPLSDEIDSISFESVIKKNIRVGDKVFFNEYKNEIKDGRVRTFIGNILEFSFIPDSDKPDYKASFINTSKTLEENIKNAEFVLALNEKECLNLGDVPIHLKINEQDLIKKLAENVEGWKKLRKVLVRLHVTKPLDLTTIKEEQRINIGVILYALDTGKSVNIGHKKSNLSLVDIGNLNLLLWECVDDKGNSSFVDIFDDQILIQYKFADNKIYPASPFSYLQNDNLWLKCDNVPFENQIESYEKLIDINPHVFEMANLDLLYMLENYDKLSESESLRKEELLKYSLKLSCWLMNKDKSEAMASMYFINHCQTLKRANVLKENEIIKLRSLLEDKNVNSIMKVGASLVIGDNEQLNKWLPLCSKDEVENIKRFPIWKFYKDLEVNS